MKKIQELTFCDSKIFCNVMKTVSQILCSKTSQDEVFTKSRKLLQSQ